MALYRLNPMAGLITLSRSIVLHSPPPGWLAAAAAVAVPLLVLAAGVRVFLRYEPDFADEL
jgi:ABC-type polysaccharide/polyol phosphate export permease